LDSLGTVNDFLRLTGTALKGGETAYRQLAFDVVADKGVIRSRNFAADVDGADVDFTMKADLPAWHIDAAAQMRLKSNAEAPPIGATILGDLDNPAISYQTKALEKWVSARLGAALLKGVVKGEGVGLKDLLQGGQQPVTGTAPAAPAPADGWSDPAATPAQEQAQPPPSAPKRPEEEIRDIFLEGLFGKKKKPADSAPAP
ncbi:MAG: hypothetical protein D6782_07065, partial [Alphaproteobacteria bacterium]